MVRDGKQNALYQDLERWKKYRQGPESTSVAPGGWAVYSRARCFRSLAGFQSRWRQGQLRYCLARSNSGSWEKSRQEV
jgi:hypothetical protein